jgi:CheY-like chemotaxis protein
MRASLPATTAIHENLVDDCCIRGDSSQIHQVLVNLCTNAAHAVRGREGRIEVSLETVELSAAEAAQMGDMASGKYAKIEVRDNGVGIPSEIHARIFDPFFTTKEQGEGTGMGLSVIHGIVNGHGGTIHVASEVNRGTAFSVYLPQTDATALETEDGEAVPAVHGEHIVVVDDEPAIVRLLVENLSAAGYAVEAHEDSAAALSVIRSRPGEFDLVITDYSMPRMTGTSLARKITALYPELPILLVSGYGDLVDREEVRESGIREVLTKPLLWTELHSAIRRTLDRC